MKSNAYLEVYHCLRNDGRTAMLASLAEVDRINGVMALEASQVIEAVRALRMSYPKSEVEKERSEVVKLQRKVRGACVISLPLDLG